MNRLICVIAVVVLLGSVNLADACSRCGSFRSCRFRSHSTKRIYVKRAAPSYVPQTIIFNNAGTVPQILSQGSTAYGYRQPSLNLELQSYRTNSADLLHLAERRSAGVDELAKLAAKQMDSETEVNRLIGSAQALSMTINAAREHTASLVQPQSFVVTVGPSGETKLQSLRAHQRIKVKAPSDTQANAQPGGAGILSTKCAMCHGADSASPNGGIYVHDEATFGLDTYKQIREWVTDPSGIKNDKMRQVFTDLTATNAKDLKVAIGDRLE